MTPEQHQFAEIMGLLIAADAAVLLSRREKFRQMPFPENLLRTVEDVYSAAAKQLDDMSRELRGESKAD